MIDFVQVLVSSNLLLKFNWERWDKSIMCIHRALNDKHGKCDIKDTKKRIIRRYDINLHAYIIYKPSLQNQDTSR